MARISVFAYGSLLLAPEAPDALVDATTVALDGYARSLCIRSRARGCPDEESAFPDVPVHPLFRRGDLNLSLTYGTRRSDDWLHGVLLTWEADPEMLLPRLDKRLGAGRVRTEVTVRRGRLRYPAIAWLSRVESPDCVRVSRVEAAQVLLRATSTVQPERGVHYLTAMRAALAQYRIFDEGLGRVLGEVRRQVGGIPISPGSRVFSAPSPQMSR